MKYFNKQFITYLTLILTLIALSAPGLVVAEEAPTPDEGATQAEPAPAEEPAPEPEPDNTAEPAGETAGNTAEETGGETGSETTEETTRETGGETQTKEEPSDSEQSGADDSPDSPAATEIKDQGQAGDSEDKADTAEETETAAAETQSGDKTDKSQEQSEAETDGQTEDNAENSEAEGSAESKESQEPVVKGESNIEDETKGDETKEEGGDQTEEESEVIEEESKAEEGESAQTNEDDSSDTEQASSNQDQGDVNPANAAGTEQTKAGFTMAPAEQPDGLSSLWLMNVASDIASTDPLDDNEDKGAQFLPTGKWEKSKQVYICGLAPELSESQSVGARVYYPEKIQLAKNDSQRGCGRLQSGSLTLNKLSKEQGFDLFCNNIRNNGFDLPVFASGSAAYEDLCSESGSLQSETESVYCGVIDLDRQDPAGVYSVESFVKGAEQNSQILANKFEYLPMTSFEVDFRKIEYENDLKNGMNILDGDLNWADGVDFAPTVRNNGNTRLQITITQDDMGMGKGNAGWKVKWGAKVGKETPWHWYEPEQKTILNSPLLPGEMNSMHFAVMMRTGEIGKDELLEYKGTMTLGAVRHDFLTCSQ